MLLEHLEDINAIEGLRVIGDLRAREPLEKLVAAKGHFVGTGKAVSTTDDSERLFAARMTLAWFAGADGVPELCRMVRDPSLGQYQRREAVFRLGDRPDRRAIPALLDAIKKDPSGAVVNQSINVLSAYKYPEAVGGLIDCFDADFAGKQDWKRAYEPAMFRENIAESLRAITGQSIGADKKSWQEWWERNKGRPLR